jgi:ABC-type glutathione transport system ATPase component
VLPERTQITLDYFTFANVGGELIAMGCFIGIWTMVVILCEARFRWKRPKNSNEISIMEPMEEDVLNEATRDMSEDLLSVKNLRKTYGKTIAVADCSFGVKPGECFCLLGTNGAGKSSTFKSLTGEVSYDSGELKLVGSSKFNLITRYLGYCSQ